MNEVMLRYPSMYCQLVERIRPHIFLDVRRYPAAMSFLSSSSLRSSCDNELIHRF